MGGGGVDGGLAGGLGQPALNIGIGTGDPGGGAAVLNHNGDLNDLGAVNAALGGDLKASALYGLGDRAGNSVGKGKTSVGEALGISISLPLTAVGNDGSSNGGVTEGVDDLPAHPLVLHLLGRD